MKKIKCNILSVFVCALVAATSVQAEYFSPGTDYSDQKVESWFDMGEALDTLNFADFLMCLTNGSGFGNDELVNMEYKATLNESLCEVDNQTLESSLVNMTIQSERNPSDPDAPQIGSIWFDGKPASERRPASQFIVDFSMTKGALVSAPPAPTDTPYGAFSMSWLHRTEPRIKGTMVYALGTGDLSDSTIYKLYDSSINQNGDEFQWIHGATKNDRSGGSASVGSSASTFKIKYTKSDGAYIVNIKKNEDLAQCYDETVVSEFAFDYNLYNQTTGKVHNLDAKFKGTYTTTDGKTKRMQAYAWGIWFEDQLYSDRYSINSIKHENGTPYNNIIYEPKDDGKDHLEQDCTGLGCEANDGIRITIPGVVIEKALIFKKSAQTAVVQNAMSDSNRLEYYGQKSLYGLPWQCFVDDKWIRHNGSDDCDNATDYRPQSSLADGTTVLKDTSNGLWVTKAVRKMKVMDPLAQQTKCDNLNLDDVNYEALTTDFIKVVNNTWAEGLLLSDAPLMIEVGGADCIDKITGKSCAGLNGVLIE